MNFQQIFWTKFVTCFSWITQNVSVKSFGKFSVGKAFGRSHLGVNMPNKFLSNSCEKRRKKTWTGCFQLDYVSKYPKVSSVSHCFDFDRRKTKSFRVLFCRFCRGQRLEDVLEPLCAEGDSDPRPKGLSALQEGDQGVWKLCVVKVRIRNQ